MVTPLVTRSSDPIVGRHQAEVRDRVESLYRIALYASKKTDATRYSY